MATFQGRAVGQMGRRLKRALSEASMAVVTGRIAASLRRISPEDGGILYGACQRAAEAGHLPHLTEVIQPNQIVAATEAMATEAMKDPTATILGDLPHVIMLRPMETSEKTGHPLASVVALLTGHSLLASEQSDCRREGVSSHFSVLLQEAVE